MAAASSRDPDVDPYAVLGVDRRASDAQIRAAYRALVARYHPDRHQGNPLEDLAAARMIEINGAYEVLSDPARRAAYDASARPRHFDSARDATDGVQGRDPRVARSEAAVRRVAGRLILIATAITAVPFVIRLGGGVVRTLVGLVRDVLEASAVLRGTPVAFALVLLAVALLVWAALRWRQRRRRSVDHSPGDPPRGG